MAKLGLNAPKVRHDAVVTTRLQRIHVRIRSLVCGAQPPSMGAQRWQRSVPDKRLLSSAEPIGDRLASMDRESDLLGDSLGR
jgi:hypothetical protein